MESQSEGVLDAQTPRRPAECVCVCVCVLGTIRKGGVYYMESQNEGFPDAQAPSRPAECLCACWTP